MVHENRVWCVSPASSPEELVERLLFTPLTPGTALRLGAYLFLADAAGGDDGKAFAVVKVPDDASGFCRRVGSIAPAGCDEDDDYDSALSDIRRALAGGFDDGGTSLPGLRFHAESPDEDFRCRLSH